MMTTSALRYRYTARQEWFCFLLLALFLLSTAATALLQSGGQALHRSSMDADYYTVVVDIAVPLLAFLAALLLLGGLATHYSVRREITLCRVLHPILLIAGAGLIYQSYAARGVNGLVKHGVLVLFALAAALVTAFLLQLHPGKKLCFVLFALIVGLAVANLLFAWETNGAKLWINLGLFSLQAGELQKALVMLAYCWSLPFLYEQNSRLFRIAYFAAGFTAVAVLVLCNDWGNGLILLCILLATILAQWPKASIAAILVSAAGSAAAVFASSRLAVRVQMTFSALDHPGSDAYWQVRRHLLGVLRAGLLGTGAHDHVYTQSTYIAEANNDFVLLGMMSIFGLAWCCVVVGCLLLFARSCIFAADGSPKDKLIRRMAAMVILLQAVIAIGSELNVLPFMGQNFPWGSSGGSSLLTNGVLLGMIMSTFLPYRTTVKTQEAIHKHKKGSCPYEEESKA